MDIVLGGGPPAVLLGGGANAVSVARSLSSIGVAVHVVGTSDAPVRRSRCCRSFVDLGRSAQTHDVWLDRLGRVPAGSVVLPCSDAALDVVARHRPALVGLGLVPIEADDDVLLAMLDKERTYELARGIGIPTPTTWVIRDPADVAGIGERVTYPCLVKPRHSQVFSDRMAGLGVRAKLLVARDANELREAVELSLGLGLKMIVSEIVPGDDDRIFSYTSYLDETGEPLLHFVKQKLRQFPPGYGTGCYHKSTTDADVAALGLAFLQGVGLRGLAYVEFKRDARDGQLRLIECNHRFGAATELPRRAGIDLAIFTYQRLIGRPLAPHDGYRANVRLWHPADDIRAFLTLHQQGQLTLHAWLQSLMHQQHVPMMSWTDPGPTLAHHWAGLRRTWHKKRHTTPHRPDR